MEARPPARVTGLAASLLAVWGLSLPVSAQYQLVWSDEFEGATLDLSRWEPMVGNGCPNLCGWGNNELQYYRAQNATVAGGMLTISAKEESFAGNDYTSARLRTKDLASWKYGRIEMRAKLPTGKGLWPAFWMLPEDNVYGTWAASGEIDIVELVGHEPNRVHGTLHYGGESPDNAHSGNSYTLGNGTFNDDFHVFALEWEENEMRWYVDGVHYATQTAWWSAGGAYPAPFDQHFHLLLNVAVGGDWPGDPNGSTQFPQELVVDYVRVYQDNPFGDCLALFDDMEHGDPYGNGYFSFDGTNASGTIGADILDLPPTDGGAVSLSASWSGAAPGFLGGFGRTSPLDLSGDTHFEFWINPDPGQDYVIELNLQDDDNGDDLVPPAPDGADDEFQLSLSVGPPGSDIVSGGGWQRVIVPLADFVDDNSYHFGGNGVLDPTPTAGSGNGQLINVVVALLSNSGADISFRTDAWRFTRRSSGFAGRVWSDADGDGQQNGEPGLEGVIVELVDPIGGTVLASTITDGLGIYELSQQVSGTYQVRVDTASLAAGSTATFDPDGVATPHVFSASLNCDELLAPRDFGYAPPTELGTRYCDPAQLNSSGVPALITATGSDVATDDDFALTTTELPVNQFGYYITSATQGLIQNPGGSQGDLCLSGQMGRFTQQVQSSGAGGAFGIQVDLTQLPPPLNQAVMAGETWNFTTWYRDKNPTPTSNFSDGISVLFQ